MRIFLSYSRADLVTAEKISANLKQAGHDVFFDRESLQATEDFNRRIWSEILKVDLFVFLISPNSTRAGSYTLTELKFAEKKWPNPERRVLSVVIEATELSEIPLYASIAHILHPEGNLVAEVRAEVNALSKRHRLKKYLQTIAFISGLIAIGLFALMGYQKYLEQRPHAARAKLVAMDLFNTEGFIETASRGDLELIDLYLTAGMDPNVSSEKGRTALMKAAGGGHFEVVERLLNAGADVNVTSEKGRTALMKAAGGGHLEVVERLLNAGADVNVGSRDAAPALAWAAVHGDDAIVRALLAAGANNESVNIAFSKVAYRKSKDKTLLNLLLERGVGQSEIDKVFVNAARKGDVRFLEFLMDRLSDRKIVLSEGLVAASAYFTVEKIRSFQEKGLDVFKYLLDQGADVNFKNKDGEFTALIFVASHGYVELAQMLLERGANPDLRCTCEHYLNGGWTALTLAIKRKNTYKNRDAIIGLLLASGADVNLPQESRFSVYTPLILAASTNDLQLVLDLLSRGANVNSQAHNGYTALAYAAGNKEIFAALLDRGANVHVGANPLLRNIRAYGYLAVKNLLEAGVDVNKPDGEGQTPLMLATKEGDPDLVRILLQAGARTTDRDKMGRTAAVFARRQEYHEIIELLKNAGK